MGNNRNYLTAAFLCLLSAGLLAAQAAWYLPFISDDALISLRYAARLLEGKGLTWTEGVPVEGYSNLLWVLLTAASGRLGLDLVFAARLLGFLGMVGAAACLCLWYARSRKAEETWAPLIAGLGFFCMAGPIVVWSIGGMEQPLVALLLGLSILLSFIVLENPAPGHALLAGLSLALGLLCITRPDGAIFTAAAAIIVLPYLRRADKSRFPARAVLLLIFPFLFYSGQTVFRFFYYGEFVPNTALVKISPSLRHLAIGVYYVLTGTFRGLSIFSLIGIVSLIVCWRNPAAKKRAALLLAMLGLWIPYVVFIGGDFFPAYRHLVPVAVIFGFATVEGLRLAWAKIGLWPYHRKTAASAGLCAALLLFFFLQRIEPENRRAKTERWEWEGRALGLALKNAFQDRQPLIAVTAAGCIPYWSGLPSLDMMGLNDYYLPRHKPADFGRGKTGHELGSGKYVLERNPDIIIFYVGSREPAFRSGRELATAKEFYERYAPVNIVMTNPACTATVWMNRYSEKIGARLLR